MIFIHFDMIMDKHRIKTWMVLVHFWILLLQQTEGSECNSYRWRLSNKSGPFGDYEGMIEIQLTGKEGSGEWYNVCADDISNNLKEINAICRLLHKTTGNSTIHRTNVFETTLQKRALRFSNIGGACQNTNDTKRTCSSKNMNNCCQPAGICCKDDIRGDRCSGNWSTSFSTTCYKRVQFTYGEVRSEPLEKKEKSLAWTKSSIGIVGKTCSVDRELVRNCTNKCINSRRFKAKENAINVSSNGECLCTNISLKLSNASDCFQTLYVFDDDTADAVFCIAAEVDNDGTKRFSAEDCERYLQPLCIYKDIPINIDKSTTTTTPNTEQNDSGAISVLASTITVTGIIVIIVVILYVIYKYCSMKNERNSIRPSSVYNNRTYDRQIRKSDEEYAIISEIELDSGATIYKPPLPERSLENPEGHTYHIINSQKEVSNTTIITLDDYSTPSDMLRDKADDYLGAEYSTTYDDPIRHIEDITIEVRCSEERDSKASDQHESVHSAKTVINNETHKDDVKRQVKGDKNDCNNPCVVSDIEEVEKENTKASSDTGSSNDYFILEKCPKNDSGPSKQENRVKECFTIPDISKGENALDDTDVMDWAFRPALKKRTCEEHVCLECLKPGHLKKLGIKLVPEKFVDDLEKRLSEPIGKTRDSSADICRSLRRCKTDEVRTDPGTDLVGFKEMDNLLDKTRTCIECNSVYDRLGHLKQTIPVSELGHEYNRICDVNKQAPEDKLVDKNTTIKPNPEFQKAYNKL